KVPLASQASQISQTSGFSPAATPASQQEEAARAERASVEPGAPAQRPLLKAFDFVLNSEFDLDQVEFASSEEESEEESEDGSVEGT
ncbi:hypothetical protein H632_c5081p1, partial [Helicosporidium sp. ATCC 50920]